MKVHIEVSAKKKVLRELTIDKDVVIGRSKECPLRVVSSEVSRKHCRIELEEGALYATDLGSSNGTFVDGEKIEAETRTLVKPGQKLTVGPSQFVFTYEAAAEDEAAPVADPAAESVGAVEDEEGVPSLSEIRSWSASKKEQAAAAASEAETSAEEVEEIVAESTTIEEPTIKEPVAEEPAAEEDPAPVMMVDDDDDDVLPDFSTDEEDEDTTGAEFNFMEEDEPVLKIDDDDDEDTIVPGLDAETSAEEEPLAIADDEDSGDGDEDAAFDFLTGDDSDDEGADGELGDFLKNLD